MKSTFLPAALMAMLFALILSTAGCVLPTGRPQVTVKTGALLGRKEQGVYSFKGVPYAAPPVGELRWQPPQPPLAWQGRRGAQDYLPNCAQPLSKSVQFEQRPMSEDCLAVNVWTPELHPEKPLPVMVWIHGGGFVTGSGNVARTNSAPMAAQGVVLVTINYRVSVFGFLAHPALAEAQAAESGFNFGLQDTVAALQWVQRNIAEFGGDPARVTIFGESAGANVVNTLLVMPSAKGLFQQAIAQSASTGLAPDPYPDRRAGFLPPAYKLGQKFARQMGVTDAMSPSAAIATMRAATTREILQQVTDLDRYVPVVDGKVLPDQVGALLSSGKQQKVAYLFGGNSWEASLGRKIGGGFSPEFSARLLSAAQKQQLYPGLQGEALADAIFGDLIIHSGNEYIGRQMDKAGVPVYRYFLSYVASDRGDRQPGVAHADDIAFVMQTLATEADIKTVTARDVEISRLMSHYWVEFARSGNPNHTGAPKWQAFAAGHPAVLEIGDEIVLHDDLYAKRLRFHVERGRQLLERARN